MRRGLIHLAAYVLYLGLAILVTWPLITVISTRFLGHPFSDTYEYIHHIWWFKHALQTGQSPFFNPLLLYPQGLNAEWVWGNPLQSFPAWLFAYFMPLPLAFNLAVLLGLALNGWAMYWLARLLTRQTFPALLAGAVFLAYPAFQGQLGAGHSGLLVLWPTPLYLYSLSRLRESSQPRWIILAAIWFVVALWGNSQNLFFIIAPFTGLWLFTLAIKREWRPLMYTLIALVIGGLLAAIFVLPVLLNIDSVGGSTQGDFLYSASLFGIFAPSFYHPLYKALPFTHTLLGHDPFELPAYLGMVSLIFALIGLRYQPKTRWWLLLAIMAWIISLGALLKITSEPTLLYRDQRAIYMPLPWSFLQQLPVLNNIRTPVRFNFTVGLAMAVMVGYGAAVIWPRLPRRLGVLAFVAVLGLIVFDYHLFWSPQGVPDFPTIPGIVPESVAALANRADVRAVFNIPWDHRLTDKDAMFLQTGHQRPTIGGHITRLTPLDPAKGTLLENTLDLNLLDSTGVDIIILHKRWDANPEATKARLTAQLGEPSYEDELIALFEVPPGTGEPGFLALPAPTEPIINEAASFIYLPQAAQIRFTAQIELQGRTMTLTLDGQPIAQWSGETPVTIDQVIPIEQPGYHTLTLNLEPTCPPLMPPALQCRTALLNEIAIELIPSA